MTPNGSPGQWEVRFRTELKRLRELQGLTQTDLANRLRGRGLRFAQQTVQKVEAGERPVRLDEAFHIAEELGVSVAAMAAGSDDVTEREAVYAVDRLRRETQAWRDGLGEQHGEWHEHAEALLAIAMQSLEQDAADCPGGAPDTVEVSLRTRWLAAWAWKAARVHMRAARLDQELGAVTFQEGAGLSSGAFEDFMAWSSDPRLVQEGDHLRPSDLANLAPGRLYDLLRDGVYPQAER